MANTRVGSPAGTCWQGQRPRTTRRSCTVPGAELSRWKYCRWPPKLATKPSFVRQTSTSRSQRRLRLEAEDITACRASSRAVRYSPSCSVGIFPSVLPRPHTIIKHSVPITAWAYSTSHLYPGRIFFQVQHHLYFIHQGVVPRVWYVWHSRFCLHLSRNALYDGSTVEWSFPILLGRSEAMTYYVLLTALLQYLTSHFWYTR